MVLGRHEAAGAMSVDHHMRECAVQVTTVAQLTVLAPVGGAPHDGPLCVVNTHLFFHPRAPHIRTMHTAALLAEASALIDGAAPAQQLRGQRPALLFCGDLNSDMNDGISGAPGAVMSQEALQKTLLPTTVALAGDLALRCCAGSDKCDSGASDAAWVQVMATPACTIVHSAAFWSHALPHSAAV